MQLFSIPTENFKLDGGAMFGVVPKSLWNKLNPADENNMCSWAMRCLLIEDGDRLILIDTGIGNKQPEKFFGHYHLFGSPRLEESIRQAGYSPDDITDVLLTHLHFDHCGGAIKYEGDRLVPAFKNAIFHSNSQHWQWAIEPNAREKASFLTENIAPIKESGRLRFLDTDAGITIAPASDTISQLQELPLTPNISMLIVNGHTRAMMLPKINYKGRTIVYMADLLPSAAHIPLPYVMAYDMHPLITLQEKKLFLTQACDEQYILFFEHDITNECCTLLQTEKGIRPKDFFRLDELG